jgi:hypothetical protein
LVDFRANRRQSLGKFCSGKAIARQLLMVQSLKLLDLTGFKTFEIAVDSIDRLFGE